MKIGSTEFQEHWKNLQKWVSRPTYEPLEFSKVQEKEILELLARRKFQKNRGCLGKYPADPNDIRKDSVGVCLSGGGVRSATFNLGVLQALDQYKLLPRVDYLSTVSGGGYIGSSLAWFQTRDAPGHRFPFRRFVTKQKQADESDDHRTVSETNIEWIRRHASYLTPGDGLNIWALFAAIARGTFVNLLIAVPILFFIILYASRPWDLFENMGTRLDDFYQSVVEETPSLSTILDWFEIHVWLSPMFNWIDGLVWPWIALAYDSGIGFGLALLVALVLFAFLAAKFFLYAVFSRLLSSQWTPQTFTEHRESSVQSGRILQIASLLLAFGLVPGVRAAIVAFIQAVQWNAQVVTAVSTVIGVVAIVVGWVTRAGRSETAGWRAISIKFGLAIVVYGLLLWFQYYSDNLWSDSSIDRSGLWGHDAKLPYWVLLSFLLGFAANINRVSMHRYYRNRLLECYMPDNPPAPGRPPMDQKWEADKFPLADVDPGRTGNPCLIVNANLATLNSRIPRYRIRGGHNFVFTPWHIGSDAINADPHKIKGWVDMSAYRGGQTNLATAFSISGAAIDPNTGATRSGPLAFVMGFLNVRLGYWIRNPIRPPVRWTTWNESPFFWHYYALREMFGWRLKESHNYIRLSDGGHFENLGLYELIRRKCRYILVSDAGADPDFLFKDLARAVERVRVDFQADIDLGTSALVPDGKPPTSSRAVVAGKITYDDNSEGKLLYLKTTVCKGLPKDIDGYQKTNTKFPHETTIDQFFGDRQFEAYRELGYRLAARIFEIGEKPSNLDDVFVMDTTPTSGSQKIEEPHTAVAPKG